MSAPVWCVRAIDDVAHARNEMVNRGVTKLVVVDGERPTGILTVTDLLTGGADFNSSRGKRSHMRAGHVEDVMRPRPFTVRPDEPSVRAAREMARRGIGAAPVVEDDRLLGIVTPTDILPHVAQGLEGRTQVRHVMERDVPKVHRHDSASKLAELLLDSKARAAIVTDSETSDVMVGLVTRESLVFGMPFESHPNATRSRGEKRVTETRKRTVGGRKDARHVDEVFGAAEDLMLTDVPTVQPDADARAAANQFLHTGARVLPVLEGDVVVGILTKRDLLAEYAKVAP